MADFKEQLDELLQRTQNIKSPINTSFGEINIREYNRPSEIWINDVQIFYDKFLKDHALGNRIKTLLFHRTLDTYNSLVSCLESISMDKEFVDKIPINNLKGIAL